MYIDKLLKHNIDSKFIRYCGCQMAVSKVENSPLICDNNISANIYFNKTKTGNVVLLNL